MKKQKAFTLAEVLVTLMIIGVIAAITIPSLVQNTHDNQNVAGFLKAYSVLSQAIDRMKIDYGPVGFGAKWNNEEEIEKGLRQYLNIIKFCRIGESGCFAKKGAVRYLNGNNATNDYLTTRTFITADGFAYSFSTLYGSYNSKGLSQEDLANCMGRFMVDVNGPKGPNVVGRDIFFLALVKGKGIVPAGAGNNAADCKMNSLGEHCAAYVLKEKKIRYAKE